VGVLLSAIPYSACLFGLFELRFIESRVIIDCFGKIRRATLHGTVCHSRTSFEPHRTYIRTSCLKLSFEAAVIRDNDIIPAAC